MKRSLLVLVLLAVGGCESKSTGAPTLSLADAPPSSAPATQATAVPSPAAPATQAAEATTPSAALPNGLTIVRDRDHVCMVNDQYMGREQIPVTVGNNVYYGCCPMCKGRLEQDPTARQAKDPTTGNAVDKATAVIARAPSGSVLYFESESTVAQYKL